MFEITFENNCSFQRVTHTGNPSSRDSIGACWDGSSCCVQAGFLLPEELGQQSCFSGLGDQQSSHSGRAAREAQTPGWRQQECSDLSSPLSSGGAPEQDGSQGMCAACLQQCTGCSVRAQHVAGSFTGPLKHHLLELPRQLTGVFRPELIPQVILAGPN